MDRREDIYDNDGSVGLTETSWSEKGQGRDDVVMESEMR